MTDKESLTHEIEDDLAARNRNWNKVDRNTNNIAENTTNLDDHMLKTAEDDVHGLANAVIVESGSNENGHYVKYGDGTMRCRFVTEGRALSSVSTTTQNIRVYRSARIDWIYPQPFIEKPAVNLTGRCLIDGTAINTQVGERYYDNSNTQVALQLLALDTFNSVDYSVFAEGRWK